MSYYCEMCGRELDQREAKKAIVEGSLLILCPSCYQRLSKQSVVKEVQSKPPQGKDKVKQTQPKPSSSRRIEEYEVTENYASKIKTAREKLGWSQEILAQKVGESVNTIKRIESGKLKPSIELARRLEKILGIKLLEPVVNEIGESLTTSKGEYLTIGDIINVEENKKH
ncbi:MAG: multiprotein bridging factor aMBF1 [Desulfurococcaceae archaeon]